MRRVAAILLLALLVCAGPAARAAGTNFLVWNPATDRVSADLRGEALWPLLEDIAHQTGWHIFVEPGATRKADVKFSDLPSGEALRKLLGNLNFAFVPRTNEASHLYVFTTTMRAATRRVSSAATNQTAVARHVANELVVKVKPGTDIDALAKSLGAKVVGRADQLGLYRLRFADETAMETALGQLKTNPDVTGVEYNYLLDPVVAPQKIANAPVGPVSLTLKPPGDAGRVIVGMLDTHLQSLGADLDQFMLKQISITGDTVADSADPTHATSMAETILRALAAQGGATATQILPVDVYGNSEFATTWNMALGLVAAVNAGANPINISSGGNTDSAILNDVIQQAVASGIVIFAATGNNGANLVNYPAADSGVIAVAAKNGNQLAPYSNYGAVTALALPGDSVVYFGNLAWVVSGTSPATAYATGVAAGTKSGTTMTWAQILAAMQQKFPVPKK